MLNLMYITNRPDVAQIAEAAGVDRIFVDMEFIGKDKRQAGLDTVKNHHTLGDVKRISSAISKAELLVRINPIHEESTNYMSSEDEINKAIANGAKVIMLPYFKTVQEVERFVKIVDGRAKTMPLVETPEAVSVIDDILNVAGIDEIHIGINDLSLGYGKKFMFELLADGTVEDLCYKFHRKGIPYGFGGIASLGKGLLPAEMVIAEHYRLGSTRAILSRSFCNTDRTPNIDKISSIFINGVHDIRGYEKMVSNHSDFFNLNHDEMVKAVFSVCEVKL